jgi:hypothetical protein
MSVQRCFANRLVKVVRNVFRLRPNFANAQADSEACDYAGDQACGNSPKRHMPCHVIAIKYF